MLSVYICEDNVKQLGIYEKIIEKIIIIENLDMKIVLSTTKPEEILDPVQRNKNCGIYFLDIELNATINGIELAQKIRKYDPRGFIVFITTYEIMAPLTFKYKVEALDYIVKDDFKTGEIENRIKQCILDANRKYIAEAEEQHKNFSIEYSDKIVIVEFDEILYFETSSPHKITLHGTDRQIEFRGNLKEVEFRLDERFVRCHKSYIININKIKQIDKKKRLVYILNGAVCNVSIRMLKSKSFI